MQIRFGERAQCSGRSIHKRGEFIRIFIWKRDRVTKLHLGPGWHSVRRSPLNRSWLSLDPVHWPHCGGPTPPAARILGDDLTFISLWLVYGLTVLGYWLRPPPKMSHSSGALVRCHRPPGSGLPLVLARKPSISSITRGTFAISEPVVNESVIPQFIDYTRRLLTRTWHSEMSLYERVHLMGASFLLVT